MHDAWGTRAHCQPAPLYNTVIIIMLRGWGSNHTRGYICTTGGGVGVLEVEVYAPSPEAI